MNEVKKALQAGDKQRAFALLRRHLAANPKDANAWLWMSEATTNPKQKIDALKRVLMLAPQHPHAAAIQQRLEKLTKKPPPASEESKSREVSTQAPIHSPPATPPIKPSIPSQPSLPSIEEPIRNAPKATFGEEEVHSFPSKPPSPPLQRLGIREERKSREESADSAPSAHSTVQELRQSLMNEAVMMSKEKQNQEPSLTEPPKPPSEQGLPRWIWLIVFVAILVVSILLWVAYNMMQAN